MSYINESRAPIQGLGILALQHKNFDTTDRVDLDMRSCLLAVRVTGRSSLNPDDLGEYQYDKETVGDLIGSSLWENQPTSSNPKGRGGEDGTTTTGGDGSTGTGASEPKQRLIPAWRFAWPVVGAGATSQNGTQLAAGFDHGQPALMPADKGNREGFWKADTRFKTKGFQVPFNRGSRSDGSTPTRTGLIMQRLGKDMQALVLAGCEERDQKDCISIIDPRLIAVHTREPQNEFMAGELGTVVCDATIQGGPKENRCARLQSIFKVVGLGLPAIQALRIYNPVVETTQSKLATIALMLDRSGNRDAIGGLMWKNEAHRNASNFDPPQDVTQIGAALDDIYGGPLNVGSAHDNHNIGADDEGHQINAMHLNMQSVWIWEGDTVFNAGPNGTGTLQQKGPYDGPLFFTGNDYRAQRGNIPIEVEFVWDKRAQYTWWPNASPKRRLSGMFRWQAWQFLSRTGGTGSGTTRPRVNIPDPGPSPVPGGPGGIETGLPGPGRNDGGGFPPLPVLASPGGEGFQPREGSPSGVQIPSVVSEVQRAGFALSPPPSIGEPVIFVSHRQGGPPRNFVISPTEFGVPGLVFRPQFFSDEKLDGRNLFAEVEGEQHRMETEARTPLTARLEAYGAHLGGEWCYSFAPKTGGRYNPMATGCGGITLLAPEVSLEEIRDKLKLPSTLSRTHLVIPPYSRLAFGLPSTVDGTIQTDGIVIAPDEVSSPVGALVLRKDAAGTLTRVATLDPKGVGVGSSFDAGSGDGVLFLRNAATAPSGTPSAGTVHYSSGGLPRYKDADGLDRPVGGTELAFYRTIGATIDVRHLPGCMDSLALSTLQLAQNTLRAVPYWSGRGGTLDRITIEVTTGVASTNGRCGIYDNLSDTNPQPNALVVDSGSIDTSTTGMKDTTINVVLKPNRLYWFVYVCSGATAPTIRSVPTGNTYPFFGWPAAGGSALSNVWNVTFTFAALPGTFPGGGAPGSNTVPAVGVRYSA